MEERIKTIVALIEDKKGEKISVIDLREMGGTICDYFIVCEAQSTTQIDAICSEIEEKMVEIHKEKALRIQGRESKLWMVMDYGDIFVHVFERETRRYYGLEEVWADAPTTTYDPQY